MQKINKKRIIFSDFYEIFAIIIPKKSAFPESYADKNSKKERTVQSILPLENLQNLLAKQELRDTIPTSEEKSARKESLAIGRPHEVAHGSLCLSPCEENTEEKIDTILKETPKIVAYLREMFPMWKDLVAGKKKFIL